MLSKGQKINDRYEIVKSIGEGGMANVYLAEDTILNRKVAIKVLRGDLSGDEKFIRRFEREALSVSNLSHPNIVEVYDVGVEEGNHYIVMEYIEGKTLKQLIQKRGALTLTEVIDIMSQLTDGIAHAHEAYIIHRDIKPQNVIIMANGLVKITDFGIAMAINATQLTQTNSVMGSVHYLPPEQAGGKGSTVKSDIYSLGILMYGLLTGSVPFKGDNAVEIALKHMKEKIPSVRRQNPTIPQSVENIILKACAKNPKNRYDSARDMHNDLVTALEKDNEKRVVYEYPENDLDETKVMPKVKPPKATIVDKPEGLEEDEVSKKIEKEVEREKNRLPIALGVILLLLLITIGAFVLYLSNDDKKEVKVPDVVGLTLEDAIEEIEKVGFKYTTESKSSTTVEEGLVITTKPRAGSTKTKGSTIVIVESTGSEYYLLEDFTGKNAYEVKGKLEALGIKVTIETKDVENQEDYKGKEDIIIDQSIKYDSSNEVKLVTNDKIVLYIPKINNTYPDMVNEGFTLEDAKAFAEEYKILLDVTEVETDEYEAGKVIYQSRAAGSPIITGITLRIKVAKAKTEPIDNIIPGNNDNNNSQNNNNNTNNG